MNLSARTPAHKRHRAFPAHLLL